MSRSAAATLAVVVVASVAVGCAPSAAPAASVASSPTGGASPSSQPTATPPPKPTAAATPLPDGVVAEIRVGDGPGYADVVEGAVWVGNHRGNSLSKIDPATNAVATTVDVARDPTGVTAGFGSIWTFTFDPTAVTRVDIATEEVIATIPIDAPGGSITGLVEAAGSMWIAPEGGRLFRIDPDDNTATDVRGLDTDCPGSLAFAEGSLWHVPFCGAPVVLRIDPADGKVNTKIEVPEDTHAIWAGLDRLWAVTGWGELTEIDPATNKVIRSKSVGLAAEQVRTGLALVWVRVDDRTLVGVDPADLSIRHDYRLPAAQIPGGGIAFSEDAVWAMNFTAGTVWRIEP